ncbi:hypothetical protein HYH03_015276 [Edaphochlamys debaryana]|uniref:Protein kinase domain-containing protein n=1 Tax=Edaphochlamys debaryana TaxID=47281 RepID=A0A836BRD5_9CHLO|nr:hypothetical protein HYH03_015276 [Edaphochlamys debaryana]|eukprot:KAG2486070.1 hypothetical protein HYH03_015276 [Edaphochlamys debaryana]
MYGPLDSPSGSTSGTPKGPSCTGGGHGEAPPSAAGAHPHPSPRSPLGRQSSHNMQLPSPLCTATATPLARHLANRALRKAGDASPVSLPSLTGGGATKVRDMAHGVIGGGALSTGPPTLSLTVPDGPDGAPRPPGASTSPKGGSPRVRRATTMDIPPGTGPGGAPDLSPTASAELGAVGLGSGNTSAPISPSASAGNLSALGATSGPAGPATGPGTERFQRVQSLQHTSSAAPGAGSGHHSQPYQHSHLHPGSPFHTSHADASAHLASAPPYHDPPKPRHSINGPLFTSASARYEDSSPSLASPLGAPSDGALPGGASSRPLPGPLLSPQRQALLQRERTPDYRRRSEMAIAVGGVQPPETPLPKLRVAATVAASVAAEHAAGSGVSPAPASPSASAGQHMGSSELSATIPEEGEGGEGQSIGGQAAAAGGVSPRIASPAPPFATAPAAASPSRALSQRHRQQAQREQGESEEPAAASEDLLPTKPEPLRLPHAAAGSSRNALSPVVSAAGGAGADALPSLAPAVSSPKLQSPRDLAGPGPVSQPLNVLSPSAVAAAAAAPAAPAAAVSPAPAAALSPQPPPRPAFTAPKPAPPAAPSPTPTASQPAGRPPVAPSASSSAAPAPAASAASAAAAPGKASPVQRTPAPAPKVPTPAGPFQARPVPHDGLLHLSPGAPPAMRRPVSAWGVSDYKIVRKLYAGYASSVYKATCNASETDVVLKAYNLMGLSAFLRHQVLRELDIHSRLQHPSIVHLIAAFKEGDILVLVQEYVRGGSLDRVRRKLGGRMTEFQAMHLVLLPLLNVLGHLHGRGIIHRDIKPENLLFTEDWQLKVCDYGVSICLTEERAVTRTGSREYMAPEVNICPLKRGPDDNKDNTGLAYSPAVDVWSLGALMYELLVGFTPFPGGPPAMKDANGNPPAAKALAFPGGVSGEARAFVTSCLELHPGDRPTVQQLLAHPWIVRSLEQDVPKPAV